MGLRHVFPMNAAGLAEIQLLSIHEKLELVDEIWKSVRPDADASEVTEEEKQILDTRWTQFLKTPGSALSIDEFRRQFRQLRA